jgi:hypothetical protein
MGEVYRAEDLRLRQSVALKFLPRSHAKDPARLEHLLQEVRLARQVAHPNVCRVYDFVDTGTEQFVAMEYVDGETLAALLRRVGRLPPKRAIGLAHQIVRGLAAVHEQGVLHRDLKPDNVMVDGRGHARLMDFGIASLSQDSRHSASALMGTPAYMAPEQLLGGPPSSRTDVYALGALLFELVTGRLPIIGQTLDELTRRKASEDPPAPSGLVADLDPAFEDLILRCLDKDPAIRPVSARAVAQALPGGDALDVALAAGDTPDREVVAEARDAGALSNLRAWAAFGGTLAALAAFALLLPATSLLGQARGVRPPAVLAERCKAILRDLGWQSQGDSAYGFGVDWGRYHAIGRTDDSPQRWREALRGPSPLYFHFRDVGRPEWNVERPIAGALVMVDHTERLVEFQAMPAVAVGGTHPQDVWRLLFGLAGLTFEDFRPVDPRASLRGEHDQLLAWQGPFPGDPTLRVHVAAATIGGRIASFRVLRAAESQGTLDVVFADRMTLGLQVEALLLLLPFFPALWLAIRHIRLGRADRPGSQRLALAYIAFGLLAQFLRGMPLVGLELGKLKAPGLGEVLVIGGFAWVLYLAAEPYVRRRWPRTLVGWARLVGGRFHDPLVGRDVLLGVLVGAATCVLLAVIRLPAIGIFMSPLPPFMPNGAALVSIPALGAEIVEHAMRAGAFALVVLVALVLLRSVVVSEHIAVVVALLAVLVPHAFYVVHQPAVFILVHFVVFFASTVLIRKAGLLAFAVFYFTYTVLVDLAGSADPTVWTGRHGLIPMALLLTLAIFGLVVSLERRFERQGLTTLG